VTILEKLVRISPFFDCIDPAAYEQELFSLESFCSDQVIFRQGDQGDKAYVVVSGIIGLYEQFGSGAQLPFLKVSRGRLFGTYAMLCCDVRSATAIAMTDVTLASVDRVAFNKLLDLSPELCKRVLATLAREASRGRELNRSNRFRCVLFRENSSSADPARLDLVRHALAQLESLDVVDQRGRVWGHEQQLLDIARSLESGRSIAFFVDELTSVSHATLQLIDANVILSRGNRIDSWPTIGAEEVVDLIRIWPAGQERPAPLSTVPPGLKIRHVYNVRNDRPADALRMVRCVFGVASALVLGGGGVKGFAHIGAMKAMAEAGGGVEIDLIYGVSIGSFVGMLYAFEMAWKDIYEYTRLIFVDGAAYAFSPSVHSLFQYSKGYKRLKADFSSFSMHDTWIPFRPASASLSSNRLQFWTEGGLFDRVIASMSIPGILPPVRMEDGSLHVDGSVIDNLPISEARQSTSGPVIAISLDHGEGQRVIPTLADTQNAFLRRLVSLGWADQSMPLLIDTIFFSMLGSTRQRSDSVEHLADIVLKPDLDYPARSAKSRPEP